MCRFVPGELISIFIADVVLCWWREARWLSFGTIERDAARLELVQGNGVVTRQ